MIKFLLKFTGWLFWMFPTAVFAGHHPGSTDGLPTDGQESKIDVSQIEPLTRGQAIATILIIVLVIGGIWWLVRLSKKGRTKKHKR